MNIVQQTLRRLPYDDSLFISAFFWQHKPMKPKYKLMSEEFRVGVGLHSSAEVSRKYYYTLVQVTDQNKVMYYLYYKNN